MRRIEGSRQQPPPPYSHTFEAVGIGIADIVLPDITVHHHHYHHTATTRDNDDSDDGHRNRNNRCGESRNTDCADDRRDGGN